MTTLPPAARESLAGLAAVLAGLVGAYTLTPTIGGNPGYIDLGRASTWGPLQASAVTLGAAVAVPVGVLLASYGSRRIAWAVATACVVLVGTLALVTPEHGGDVYYFGRAVTAGVLVGASVAAAWGRQIAQTGLVVGFVGAWLVTWEREAGEPDWQYLGNVPAWLAGVAAGATALAAWTASAGFRAAHPARAVARTAIVGAIGYAVLSRLLGAWLHRTDADDATIWAVEIAVAAIVTAAVAVITQFAPPAEARFVLVLVAVTAAATPVLYSAIAVTDSFTVWIAVIMGLVAATLGIRIAAAAPHRYAGLAIVAAVTLIPVLWPDFGDGDSWVVVRLALLALGAGHAIGSNLPDESAFAAFGLVIPASSYAIATMYAVQVRARMPEPPAADVVNYSMWVDPNSSHPEKPLVCLLMLGLVACCAALIALRSRRSSPVREDA